MMSTAYSSILITLSFENPTLFNEREYSARYMYVLIWLPAYREIPRIKKPALCRWLGLS